MIELEPLPSVRPAMLGRKYVVASGRYLASMAEARIPAEVRSELSEMGHRVEVWPDWMPRAGAVCAAVLGRAERTLSGGADPRRVAYAVGW